MKFKLPIITILLTIAITLLLSNTYHKTPKYMNFQQFKKIFKIEFDSYFEEKYRETIFEENIAKIQQHNLKGDQTYEIGINQFTHLTQEQFVRIHLKTHFAQSNIRIENLKINNQTPLQLQNFVGDVNWVQAGAVTSVKNQGSMGNSQVYSICGAIEGMSKVEEGTLRTCSYQQGMDCNNSTFISDSIDKYYIKKGVCRQQQYHSGSPIKCNDSQCGSYKIRGFTNFVGCSELENAIYKRPISVGVDATNWSPYKSGVFSNCVSRLNHAVLLVGMTQTYWLIKNSWGVSWGESGYIRLARGNTCGICNSARFAYRKE